MKLFNYNFCSLFLLILIPNISLAQTPIKAWDKTIGGDHSDYLSSMVQSTDGGYLLGGSSASDISGEKSEDNRGSNDWPFKDDFWIVKVNADGNLIWDKTIGGSGGDYLHSMVQTPDGGYLLSGTSNSPISGEKSEDIRGTMDYWIVKVDVNGDIIWDKTIGGTNMDIYPSIIQTDDGSCLVGGTSSSGVGGDKSENNSGNEDYWVVKLDVDGSIIWDVTIGGGGGDHLNSMVQTTDGGYLLGGSSRSDISGDKSENSRGDRDYWIVKVEADGNIIWDKTIGGNETDRLFSLTQTTDGGYLLGGHSNSNISGEKSEDSRGGSDYWIVKVDVNGDIIWDKTIGGYSSDLLHSIFQTTDGDYLIGGDSYSNISVEKSEFSRGESDYWIVKIDVNGNIIWDKTIGGNDKDRSPTVLQTTDGGYLLSGSSISNISGEKSEDAGGYHKPPDGEYVVTYDYWIVKLEPGNTPEGQDVTVSPVDPATETSPVELVFEDVTLSGNTTLEIDNTGPEYPEGFAIGDPPTVFNIESTAEHSGVIQIVIDYSGVEYADEGTLRLLHFESGRWVDVTTLVDIENNLIYGEVLNLSQFVVLQDTQPPEIVNINAPLDPMALGDPVEVTVTYTDNNLDNATINWGVGSEVVNGVINGNIITWNYIYTEPGVYALTIRLEDMAGMEAEETYHYIVVFDALGGFVTGGGWSNSPAGASIQYPDATGKANFGFVSKYKKGAEVPTGNANFHFKEGGIKFKAEDYDWLVINGSRALFQGTGTINGSGDYRFLVSAIDGDLIDNGIEDMLRIRIWEKVDPGNIIYDNEIGAPELDDPTTELGGGSVVIHKPSNKKSEAVESVDNLGGSLSVIEIYPNPFSNTAFIEIQHNKSIELMISVYDLGGRLIENLHEGRIREGVRYRYEFTPERGLASGTFIVKFIIDNENVITKQLILTR